MNVRAPVWLALRAARRGRGGRSVALAGASSRGCGGQVRRVSGVVVRGRAPACREVDRLKLARGRDGADSPPSDDTNTVDEQQQLDERADEDLYPSRDKSADLESWLLRPL